MDTKKAAFMLAALVVVALLLAFVSTQVGQGPPVPPAPSGDPSATYTYPTKIVDAWVDAGGGASSVALTACPAGYTSDVADFCILDSGVAAAACSAAPGCTGYLVPTGAAAKAWGYSAVLAAGAPVANPAWAGTTYYIKTPSS